MVPETTAPEYRLPPFYSVSCTKLGVMSVCTLGIYLLYWFYKQWEKVIDQPEPKGIVNLDKPRPYLRAAFSIVFCYPLFRRVKKVSRQLQLSSIFFPGPMAILYLLLWLPANLTPDAWVISLFNFVPLLIVQREINRINQKATPQASVDTRFTKWNVALIVPGVLLLTLALIGELSVPEEEYARNPEFETAAIVADSSLMSPTETRLREYIALSTDDAFEEPASLQPDMRRIIQLAVEQTQNAQTYSSRRVVTSANNNSVQWRLDFVKPDKLHISRIANGNEDEWFKIGETRYHTAPPSLSVDSPEWQTAEQTLVVGDTLNALRSLIPESGSSYRIEGKRYFRLIYKSRLHVWIDLSTNRISKSELISGKERVQHAFAAFDDPILISDPSNSSVPFHR